MKLLNTIASKLRELISKFSPPKFVQEPVSFGQHLVLEALRKQNLLKEQEQETK